MWRARRSKVRAFSAQPSAARRARAVACAAGSSVASRDRTAAENDSGVQILVSEGAGDTFRADWAGSDLAVDGFGDVAIYDPVTGGGTNCGSITDIETGDLDWICFVNLNVAVGNDALYFTMDGNVVGENGPDGALEILRELVEAIRQP